MKIESFDDSAPRCDTCGVELTSGFMAVWCPRARDCQFWSHDPASDEFLWSLRERQKPTVVGYLCFRIVMAWPGFMPRGKVFSWLLARGGVYANS